nr:putative RNA-dependent RNA polymerase [Diaporthe pseudophoenicicola chrysovirus 1]
MKQARVVWNNNKMNNYKSQIRESMARYTAIRRKNLFSLVLPAGSGKTHLAEKYGWVDVDELIPDELHNQFIPIREEAERNGKWAEHNSVWYRALNKSLDLMDLSAPVVILMHHEEAALEVGAEIVGAARLSKQAHAANIRHRKGLSKLISLANYDSVRNTETVKLHELESNVELESKVIDLLVLAGIPVAVPWFNGKIRSTPGFGPSVPDWVKMGETRPDVKTLLTLYADGQLPKCVLDFHMPIISGLPSAFGFGYTMFHWSKLIGSVSHSINTPQDVDVNGDLLEQFPAREMKEIHRANLTLRRIIKAFRLSNHPDFKTILSHHKGEPHIFVTSIVARWFWGLADSTVGDLIWPWMMIKFEQWPKLMKELHTMIRTSEFFMNTVITESERQTLMYMDLLVGRENYELDISDALAPRLSENVGSQYVSYDVNLMEWSSQEYDKVFDMCLERSMARILQRPVYVKVNGFMEFYRNRKNWLTGGSLVYNNIDKDKLDYTTQLLDVTNRVVETLTKRHTKSSFFEVHDIYEVVKTLEEDTNISKMMKKWETGGKHRLLLPGHLVHYWDISYVLYFFDRQEQVGSVRINAPPDEHASFLESKMLEGISHLLYDWADFNEEHSQVDMAKIFKILEDVIFGPRDFSLFVRAAINSLSHMKIEDEDGNKHSVQKGLYSGWRNTSWTNGIANEVYISVARENFKRLYGYDPMLASDGGGDDVDMSFCNEIDPIRFMHVLNKIGFHANMAKQMIGFKSEFFRVTVSGGVAYASSTRALASFIAGDWENMRHIPIMERIGGLMDQISQLNRRGMPDQFCEGARLAVVAHWCRVKDGTSWIDLPPEVIHGIRDQGGMGIPDADGDMWILSKDVPRLDSKEGRRKAPGSLASTDYLSAVAEKLLDRKLMFKDSKRAASKMAEGVFDFPMLEEIESLRPLLNYDGRVVQYVNAIEPKVDPVLFEVFLDTPDPIEESRKYNNVALYAEMAEDIINIDGRPISKYELVRVMSDGEVTLEALEFSVNINYRRICPEFLANRAYRIIREEVNESRYTPEEGEEAFEIICWMCREAFPHMM